MASFKSDSYAISAARAALTKFISTPSNLYQILPQDRIENWKESDNGCSFKIKGLAEINLKLEDQKENEVIYASATDKPFPFKLVIRVEDDGNEKSKVSATFDADVNSFMSVMLKQPLVNFLNSLGEAMRSKFD